MKESGYDEAASIYEARLLHEAETKEKCTSAERAARGGRKGHSREL